MTEKEYTSHRETKTMAKQAKAADAKILNAPKKEEVKKEQKEIAKTEKEIKEEKKPQKVQVKRDFACVNATSVPVSPKDSFDVCRFIKFKTIQNAIDDLELIAKARKVLPMRGEIAHRKGRVMSGGFPKVTSEHFIILLKSLAANSNMNGIENPIITEAVANKASMPFGRFGAVRRKRTHIRLVAREKKMEAKK